MKKTKKPLSLKPETIRVLSDAEAKLAAGGITNTCLGGTQCFCAPTLDTACASAYTCTACSAWATNCGCQGTAYSCPSYCPNYC